ncbi:NADP-dependent oxidoreductase [uncultured Lutibacter sp.]|uniref:NADP-dependent oxidoreductase n=1 Tax=uncultured Lutibacter sp. TaxID=437739 RepID=UPI00261AE71F|nr:NADP-dependent oxidoreductase [uncultured Lutibacter sp.]
MKTIVLEKAGGVENLKIQEIEKPTIKETEVLIEVKAISINPADAKVKYAEEGLKMLLGKTTDVILGWDVSGTVVSVGEKVSKFKIGDNVFGMVNFPGVGNAYAEFVASPESHLALMPTNISFEEAAATTLAALTALQILQGKVKKDDKVLLQAGSGGVGHFAIQIAKQMGAFVITTSSAKNKDYVLSIGANEHIDYRAQAFDEVLSGLDFVFDTQGGEILEKALKVVKPNGTIITTAAMQIEEDLQAKADTLKVNVFSMLVQSNSKDMNTLKEMLENETIKPTIYKTFPFEAMGEAHTEIEAGRTVGKVVVTL